ncbi:MAG TPA: Arc family DNA-binding protein [Gammaproteobacteria bacterium]
MAKKVTFLLRTDPEVLDALKRWANDELRSVNGQLEFILRRALLDAGRLKRKDPEADAKSRSDGDGE